VEVTSSSARTTPREAIKNRLDLYDSSTAPLVARYEALGKLVEVSGEGSPSDVANSLNR